MLGLSFLHRDHRYSKLVDAEVHSTQSIDHYYNKSESENDSFDWFKSYQDIAPFMHKLIPNKSSKVLMLGCGNSKLSQEVRPLLHEGSFYSVLCCDLADVG
jgi:EEF1A lysine methyltransferase 4